MTNHLPTLPQARLTQAAEILHALAHPLRIQIVDQLADRADVTVVDLQGALGHEAAMLSNHLRVLRQVGLVTTARAGKYISYRLAERRLGQITTAVATFGNAVVEEVTA